MQIVDGWIDENLGLAAAADSGLSDAAETESFLDLLPIFLAFLSSLFGKLLLGLDGPHFKCFVSTMRVILLLSTIR